MTEKKGEGLITAGLEEEHLISSARIHMPPLGNCSRQTRLSRDSCQGLDFSIVFSTESPQEDPGSEVKVIYKSSLQTPNWAVLCGSTSSCGQGSDSLVTCSTKAWQCSWARQWMSQSKIALPPPLYPLTPPHPELSSAISTPVHLNPKQSPDGKAECVFLPKECLSPRDV